MGIEYLGLESTPENWLIAQELAVQTSREDMLNLDQKKFLHNELALGAWHEDKLVGYIAKTAMYGTIAEIGSLIVLKEFREQGIADNLIRIETTRIVLSGVSGVIAFCNEKSAQRFVERGYNLVSLEHVPVGALFSCGLCKHKEEVELDDCCKRAYEYTDATEIR